MSRLEYVTSGEVLAEHYCLDEPIGQGGSSVVWRAHDRRSGRPVAIKLLAPLPAKSRQRLGRRLKREAQAMTAIKHPNVLDVLLLGSHKGHDFIVTALAKGSLSDRLDDGPIEPLQAIDWTLQLLSALATAHDFGIIHRDVKPSNVLLDDGDRVLLADFGIALLLDNTRYTSMGSTMGSMVFMPPEQRIDASSVDHRADIYAAAATLYLLVTGRTPVDLFLATTSSDRLDALPSTLKAAVLRATRLHPDERFLTARHFAAALTAAREDLRRIEQNRLCPSSATSEAIDEALNRLGDDFRMPPTVPASDVVKLSKSPEPTLKCEEQDRLAQLIETALLDSDIEERFDRHTRLAQRLFDVPIALVSLVDRDRQWFKSRRGLDAPQTARSISFCTHAIETPDELYEVTDAGTDPRFRDNPLVTDDPNIRFYAGRPLKGPKGAPLGTLCIIDRTPRTLAPAERELLDDIGSMVEDELANLSRNSIDKHTGLSNRDGFVLHALHIMRQRLSPGEALHLVGIRLHEFWRKGPRRQRAFGDALRQSWDDADVIARIDEEHFVVLLEDAPDMAARMAKLLVGLGMTNPSQAPFDWAVSTMGGDSPEPLAALLGRNDLALHPESPTIIA